MQFIPLQAGLSALNENCQNIVHKMTLKLPTRITFLLVIGLQLISLESHQWIIYLVEESNA